MHTFIAFRRWNTHSKRTRQLGPGQSWRSGEANTELQMPGCSPMHDAASRAIVQTRGELRSVLEATLRAPGAPSGIDLGKCLRNSRYHCFGKSRHHRWPQRLGSPTTTPTRANILRISTTESICCLSRVPIITTGTRSLTPRAKWSRIDAEPPGRAALSNFQCDRRA